MNYDNLINNPSVSATAYILEPMPPQKFDDPADGNVYAERTGVRICSNGDVLFRFYAPSATSMEIEIPFASQKKLAEDHDYDPSFLCANAQPWMGYPNLQFRLEKQGEFFEGRLEYSKYVAGRCPFVIYVDGVRVVEPHTPVCFYGDRFVNFVELPDPGMDETLVRDVPHGSVTTDIYWSSVMVSWVRQLVYTPPNYRQCNDSYPVVYLHQGRADRETGWVYNGKVPEIMDNLISEGKAVPMIIVMNNGMLRTPADGTEKYDGFIRMIVEDTIPYVEQNYRCKTDKWHRGIAGLSMGGMQACKGGLEHPELFSSLGLFSCSIRMRDTELDFDRNEHLELLRDPIRVAKEYQMFFRGNGIGEAARDPVVLEDDRWIQAHEIDQLPCYLRRIYTENCGEHDWSTFRRCFRDYAQIAFHD